MTRLVRELDSSSLIRYNKKTTAYVNGMGDRFFCTVPGGGVMDRTKKLFTVRFRNDEEGQECCPYDGEYTFGGIHVTSPWFAAAAGR